MRPPHVTDRSSRRRHVSAPLALPSAPLDDEQKSDIEMVISDARARAGTRARTSTTIEPINFTCVSRLQTLAVFFFCSLEHKQRRFRR